MKRPAFQFYPGDWQRNANLRRCSPAARGVWVDVMCLMHDSDEYGVLRWPLKEIAQACGASMAHVRELVDKSVLKGSDKAAIEAYVYVPRSGRKDGDPVTLLDTQPGPIWYSSRMVKDEYVRTIRGESSRFSEPPKDAPKPPKGDGSTSASAFATAVNSEPNGSGGKPPTPEEIIFSYGLSLLTNAGTAEKQARSFLGGLRKGRDDVEVVNALRDCIRAKPLQPLEWLAAALPPVGGKSPQNRQIALEDSNLAAAAAFAGN